jgi:hypothetical protein
MACGDDDTSPDGDGGTEPHQDAALHDASSTIDATTGHDAGDASTGGRLQSGTYSASNIVKLSDDCKLALEDGSFMTTELINTQTELSIGKKYDSTTDPMWTPAGYGLGTGPYTTATTATLNVNNVHVKITDDGCEYDVTRVTKVTFTGDNAVSIDYTDTETNQNAKCTAALGYPTSTCTSHYTFDLKKQGS